MEIKNNLTVTRGEVGGDNGEQMGEGFSGTTIKDTGTIPKGDGMGGGDEDGWGWGERWEENEDNCT